MATAAAVTVVVLAARECMASVILALGSSLVVVRVDNFAGRAGESIIMLEIVERGVAATIQGEEEFTVLGVLMTGVRVSILIARHFL